MIIDTVVTKEFIEQRDAHAVKYKSFPERTDFEVLEYTLTSTPTGFKKPADWTHDAVHPHHGKIDFKHKQNNNITIMNPDVGVDTYMAWQFLKKPNTPLQEGDNVVMEITDIIPHTEIKLVKSYYNKGYYHICE